MADAAHKQKSAKTKKLSRPELELGEGAGTRKVVVPVEAIKLRWPKTVNLQRKYFRTWHAIAMEIASKEKLGFRVLATVEGLIYWKFGYVNATDLFFAQRAGRCCQKTISREVKKLCNAGLFSIRYYYEPVRTGAETTSAHRRRELTLSLPKSLPYEISFPDHVEIETDMRGPLQNAGKKDTRGPVSIESNTDQDLAYHGVEALNHLDVTFETDQSKSSSETKLNEETLEGRGDLSPKKNEDCASALQSKLGESNG